VGFVASSKLIHVRLRRFDDTYMNLPSEKIYTLLNSIGVFPIWEREISFLGNSPNICFRRPIIDRSAVITDGYVVVCKVFYRQGCVENSE
jgi:hypothetical protein